MILQRLKHVNNNIVNILRMNHSYLTGLKLKNSLTNELVYTYFIDSNNLNLLKVKM